MADVLIFTDTNLLERKRKDYSIMATKFQEVVTAYNVLDITPLTTETFGTFFKDPETWVANNYIEDATIGGVAIDKIKIFGTVVPPEGYAALLNKIAEVKEAFKSYNSFSRLYDAYTETKHFEIDEDGNIVLSTARDNALQLECKSFAKSATAKNVLTLTNSIISQLTSLGLKDMVKNNPNGVGGFIKEVIDCGQSKDPAVNVQGILQYNNR